MTTTEKLETYIKAELGDAALYKELSKIAPNDEDRKLLLEFSADEQSHGPQSSQCLHQELFSIQK